jgi:spore coat protein U-like protein
MSINIYSVFGQNCLTSVDSVLTYSKEDSLFISYAKSIKLFNPIQPLEIKSHNLFDSILKRKKIALSGMISASNSYGLINTVIQNDNNRPMNLSELSGNLQATIFKIPLKINYQYSSLTNPIGINNFFNVSLDTDKMKQLNEEKKQLKSNAITNKINDISNNKTILLGYLSSGETLLEKYKDDLKRNLSESEKLEANATNLLKDTLSKFNDTISNAINNKNLDSLSNKKEELQQEKIKITNRIDTVSKVYNSLLTIYKGLTSQTEKLESLKNTLSSESIYENDTLISSKKSNLIGSIQKLDFGLTYPKTSAISKNAIPIQGLNLEYQKKLFYFSFSSGIAMNNFMISSDALQNKLNNSIHSFNQFDFNYIKNKGLITSLKSGYGTSEGTHVLIGSSYLTNSLPMNPANVNSPSFFSEIDIRWIPVKSKNIKIDVVIGKSSSKDQNQNKSALASFFSAEKTGMGLISYTQKLHKIKTDFQTLVRFIDLNADTRNIGILLSDQLRHEIKTKTRIVKGIVLGLNYRQDENNISRTKDSTLKLRMYGFQLNGNLFKKINYFTSFNYLLQNIEAPNLISRRTNYMIGIGFSTQFKIKNIPNHLSFNYNDNLISDTLSTGLFKSITIQNKTKFQYFINNLSFGYYKLNDQQLSSNTSYVLSEDIKIDKEKYSISVGLKYSNSIQYKSDLGYSASVEYHISKKITTLFKVEKMILGDFHNYYNRTLFNQFPYLFSAKINYVLN